MATLFQSNGRWIIQLAEVGGKRPTIYLGTKFTEETARSAHLHVKKLQVARYSGGEVGKSTAVWLGEISPKLYEKLAAAGLVAARESIAATQLGPFVESYISKRSKQRKTSTLVNWRHTKRCLLAFFGADRALNSITAGDAGDWERWLKSSEARKHRYADNKATDGLALNTVRKRVGNAKQFFADAISRDLLTKNPFAALSGTVGTNRSRDFIISLEDSIKVLEACPDQEWRALFALSRWGGLRCPSEHLALKWGDVDWDAGRFTVRSPKTEHHEGGESRLVPLFPEVRTELWNLYQSIEWDPETQPKPSEEPIIASKRSTNANLRTRLYKIVRRAGLTPWPKLFQNLRSTRATELAGAHPEHVAAAWLGHSTLVAKKHYWRVTDQDFERATGSNREKSVSGNVSGTQVKTAGCSNPDDATDTEPPSGNVEMAANTLDPTATTGTQQKSELQDPAIQWALRGSNPRHPRCKHGALPTELNARTSSLNPTLYPARSRPPFFVMEPVHCARG